MSGPQLNARSLDGREPDTSKRLPAMRLTDDRLERHEHRTPTPMLKLYFDQNVFGRILDAEVPSEHPSVAVLKQHADAAALWVAPTHVIELTQCSDPDRRQALAKLMLELCGARRMWSGADFFLIRQFGAFIHAQVPGAFNGGMFLSKYEEIASRIWLGYLGLLAACPEFELGSGVTDIRLAKAQTELIHARIGADPDHYIPLIIRCAKNFETTLEVDPLGLEKLTLEELIRETAELRERPARPQQSHLEKLKKARNEVASAYGAIDIGAALSSIFELPCDLELTFDTPAIVAAWPKIQQSTACMSLPKEIAMAPPEELRATRSSVVAVLNACIHAAACSGLAAASIGYYSVLRELEVKLNQLKIPKGSISLDVDHAMACMAYDVFYCEDHALYENMRAFAQSLPRGAAEIVRDSEGLAAACARLIRRDDPCV